MINRNLIMSPHILYVYTYLLGTSIMRVGSDSECTNCMYTCVEGIVVCGLPRVASI